MGELVVEKIKDGTVIDHIPAGAGLKVLSILKIGVNHSYRAALLMNVPSKKYGKKDIVKVAGKQLEEAEVNRIALVAPTATLNIIRNGEVIEKNKVRMPSVLVGVTECPNPKCITNHERTKSRFNKERDDKFRCHYCEMIFKADELAV